MDFYELCEKVASEVEKLWESIDDEKKLSMMDIEKKAIMGHASEIKLYKEEIGKIISKLDVKDVSLPPWYDDLIDACFSELYGLASLDLWARNAREEYVLSSSAKVIGDRIYFLLDGKARLMPQRITKERREQLKRALLLATPKERLEKGFHEVYMPSGIRVSIYSGERTKRGEEIFVFRKYVLRALTLEELARLKTIPSDAIPLFKSMVKLGFNVLFSGTVRSGKTTFLEIWQGLEDRSLEGVAVSTDPEIKWHELIPDAPIMQLTLDGKELEEVSKALLRGDNDYIILEEMRDATAFKFALDMTGMGTMRSKATVHSNDPISLPLKLASAIRTSYGGDERSYIQQIFKSFNYVFLFGQEENRGRKKLLGIFEYFYDRLRDEVWVNKICEYSFKEDTWKWKYYFEEDKERIGINMFDEVKRFKEILKELEEKNPLEGESRFRPMYYLPVRMEEW